MRGRYPYLCNGVDAGVGENREISERGEYRASESLRVARPQGISIRVTSRRRAGRFGRARIDRQQDTDPALRGNRATAILFVGWATNATP